MSLAVITIVTIGTKITAHYFTADAVIHSLHQVLHALDPAQMVAQDAMNHLLKRAQLYAAGVVVGTGGVMSTIAGLLRQIGLREEAMKRWKDVYMGTVMAMAGPALVFLLSTIVRFLLSGLGSIF